jgi:hypothetical protein
MVANGRKERQTVGNRIPTRFSSHAGRGDAPAFYLFRVVVAAAEGHYSESVTGGTDCGVACARTNRHL